MDEKSYKEKMEEYNRQIERNFKFLRVLVPITVFLLTLGAVCKIIELIGLWVGGS